MKAHTLVLWQYHHHHPVFVSFSVVFVVLDCVSTIVISPVIFVIFLQSVTSSSILLLLLVLLLVLETCILSLLLQISPPVSSDIVPVIFVYPTNVCIYVLPSCLVFSSYPLLVLLLLVLYFLFFLSLVVHCSFLWCFRTDQKLLKEMYSRKVKVKMKKKIASMISNATKEHPPGWGRCK